MVDSLSFIGPRDQNIKLIEESFKSKIVVRGNEIIVDGSKKEMEIINLLINDIIITINKHRRIFENRRRYLAKLFIMISHHCLNQY